MEKLEVDVIEPLPELEVEYCVVTLEIECDVVWTLEFVTVDELDDVVLEVLGLAEDCGLQEKRAVPLTPP